MRAKYLNPFTDFGFKKIFGEEASKHLLIDFLNALIPFEHKIVSLSFKNTEQLAQTEAERKAVYDIYCENEKGEKFIVELQKAKQNFFKERTIYYSTFPIREQAERGDWNFDLKAVYCIGILDFTFDDYEHESAKKDVVHFIQLKNEKNEVFYKKLTYIYIEIPNFKLHEEDLVTRLDKWLYFIKNLEDFQEIPRIFSDDLFVEAFEKAEIAGFGSVDMDRYEQNLKIYRDLKNTVDTAYQDGEDVGFKKGVQQGKCAIAKEMKLSGMSLDVICSITGLSEEEINLL